MIDLAHMTDYGRKQWVKRKYEEYENSPLALSISRAIKAYAEPTDESFNAKVDKAKWHTTIDRRIAYLFARPPVSKEGQARIDGMLDFIKESAKQYLLRGSLIWIVQGDGESVDPQPFITNNTIAVYSDETREQPVCFIRKYIDIEVVPETGEEKEIVYYECYYDGKRDTFCYTQDYEDRLDEVFEEPPLFIELGKTGDAPLYAYIENHLNAFDKILKHQDTTVGKNTNPLTEVRGYSGTSDEDLEYAINTLNIARVDGNGGVVVHPRQMDSAAIDLWTRRIMQEYYEATATVGKENELAYAQSGKALDRLFIDTENASRGLAQVLEEALVEYFKSIGLENIDIIWNTDRPVDDAGIINSIQQSRGIISDETLLEQHPWVDDIPKELERIAAQQAYAIDDLEDYGFKPQNQEEE